MVEAEPPLLPLYVGSLVVASFKLKHPSTKLKVNWMNCVYSICCYCYLFPSIMAIIKKQRTASGAGKWAGACTLDEF